MICECCNKEFEPFDCVTALFDVINYIPNHSWWKNLPLKQGGYFIFDIWDKEKVDSEGFKQTIKKVGTAIRTITPLHNQILPPFGYDGKKVDLSIMIEDKGIQFFEQHRMYIWSYEDIIKFCGEEFEIVEVKKTKKWQTFYKLKRK